MAELAFNVNGERFEAPNEAEYWRVRRFKPSGRGTPEVVFGRDGLPLIAPIEADIQEFRRLVEAQPGRYRLDPIDADHRACDDATAAYVQLADTGEAPGAAGHGGSRGGHDDLIRELVRVNADMVRNITDKFASVMESAAILIRAADGAGLPARPPMALPAAVPAEPAEDVEDDEDEDEDGEPRNAAIGGLLAQVMPLIQMAVAQRLGNQDGAAGQRNAAPAVEADEDEADDAEGIDGDDTSAHDAEPHASTATVKPPGPEAMAHFLAIQQALTPTEARLAQAVAAQLPPEEINGWIAQLSALSVEDAVALVRETIARGGKGGAA